MANLAASSRARRPHDEYREDDAADGRSAHALNGSVRANKVGSSRSLAAHSCSTLLAPHASASASMRFTLNQRHRDGGKNDELRASMLADVIAKSRRLLRCALAALRSN